MDSNEKLIKNLTKILDARFLKGLLDTLAFNYLSPIRYTMHFYQHENKILPIYPY